MGKNKKKLRKELKDRAGKVKPSMKDTQGRDALQSILRRARKKGKGGKSGSA
jgi:hypothetical protein